MRQNGNATDTLESARTWIEETGFCLFLPRKQFSASVAPSFVEAVAGQRNSTPDQKQIALAEDLLIRLELDGVAVRLNLQGQLGEQPDYVVAAWVLPYVYALRGDRDWRRCPQLTGSRQVSPLAVQTYKLLEAGDTTVNKLAYALGREITESAVIRAITELWQQLRIIPTISAPGQPAQWQLLRVRFQKAIAEGASTSQVTAISVLASIYLQAVIAATMEDVEMFLAPLTARSKVREVLRALLAARQVHTLSMSHAPHYYVAGTLPEFAQPVGHYSSSIPSYYLHSFESEEDHQPAPVVQHPVPVDPVFALAVQAQALAPVQSAVAVCEPVAEPEAAPVPVPVAAPVQEPIAVSVPEPIEVPAPEPVAELKPAESHAPRAAASPRKSSAAAKSSARPHFSRPATTSRDRKSTPSASSSRPARRATTAVAKPATSRPAAPKPASGDRPARPAAPAAKSVAAKPAAKASGATARPESRSASRKPSLSSASRTGGVRKSFASASRTKQGTKKRG